ncbi:MAG: glycosyltransferase family 4 protein [Spirochaetales bacterium]|nr:glycosyltransferase family 4 protein [Spirochaetales bacterium]
MRVLFVLYGSIEQISGGYLYDRKVTGYLKERGVEIDCIQLPACPYLLCPLQSFRGPLRSLFRGPGSGRYDCIVIDELTHPSVFRAVSRRGRDCPPVAVLLHHLKEQERIGPLLRIAARCMERSLLASCDAVIVNSRTTARTVGGLLDSEAALYVCPPGSDTFGPGSAKAAPSRRDRRRPEGRTAVRLLMTGNVIPRKGHHLLMRILADLSDLEWELRIVGAAVDQPYRRKVQRLARRLGLEDRIVYTGLLSGEALHRQYQEADVFVFPSSYEGYGISLAEAIRSGLPFVAFSTGAIPELTGGRGLLVAEGDLGTFRNHLRRLISQPAFREQSAALSRTLAAQLPTWRQTGESFLRAIQQII